MSRKIESFLGDLTLRYLRLANSIYVPERALHDLVISIETFPALSQIFEPDSSPLFNYWHRKFSNALTLRAQLDYRILNTWDCLSYKSTLRGSTNWYWRRQPFSVTGVRHAKFVDLSSKSFDINDSIPFYWLNSSRVRWENFQFSEVIKSFLEASTFQVS